MSAPSAEQNAVRYLREAAARFPGRTALATGRGARVTFAELWQQACAFSGALRDAGLEPGDRVVCMLPMSPDLYAVLLGLLKAGLTAVFVDPWVGMRRVAAFAAHAGPRGFAGVSRSHLLRLLSPALRRLPFTVTTGPRIGPLPAGRSLASLLRRGGDSEPAPVSASDPALITFTSGSSGEPKGVNRTHGFLAAQHEALSAQFPARDDDVDMPMFPVFALNNLASGIPSVIPAIDFRRVAATDGAAVARQMRAWGVTTCTASPPFLRRLAGHAAGLGLRRILTGGAPVSDDDLARWYAAFPGAEIVVVYGSTEAEPVAHVDGRERLAASREQPPAAPGCCLGRPVPNVRVRIVGISSSPLRLGPDGWAGIEMPDGQIGEFVVAGPHVCRDYYRNPAAVAANKILEPGGGVWHRMGDTGCRDGSGRLWLAGRVHSTVWRAGRPVHPLLVEQAALAPGIRQAACVGAPDPALGERAVLVLSGDALPTETEVRARLREAGVEADEVVFTRRPLPVDPRHNAKVDYAALREMLPRLRKR